MERNSMRFEVLDMIVRYPNRAAPFYYEKLKRVASPESIGYAIGDLKKEGLVHTIGRSGKYVLNAPTKRGVEVIERKIKYFKCPIENCDQVFGVHGDCDSFEVVTMRNDIKKHLEGDHTVSELIEALAPLIREVKDIDEKI